MDISNKKILAKFYQSTNGNEPVREWLLKLDEKNRKTIGKDVQKVELGWPIGMPYCRPLKDGLYEVRSNISSQRIARIIFFIKTNEMILLHGFIKKSQKTPKPDLDLAIKRKKEVEKNDQHNP